MHSQFVRIVWEFLENEIFAIYYFWRKEIINPSNHLAWNHYNILDVNNQHFFARNLPTMLSPLQGTYMYIYDAEHFARNLITTLHSWQGTYLQRWTLCKEPFCNTAFFARRLSATLNPNRNLSATLHSLKETYLQCWTLCKKLISSTKFL